MSGAALARAARNLVGCRFRLHGREPATGLDCVGVLAAALTAIGRPAPLPDGYRLRAHRLQGLETLAEACGLVRADAPTAPGDVLLVRAAPCQFHIVVAGSDGGFIHAHAGLRRVVAMHAALPWPLVGRWRLDETP